MTQEAAILFCDNAERTIARQKNNNKLTNKNSQIKIEVHSSLTSSHVFFFLFFFKLVIYLGVAIYR